MEKWPQERQGESDSSSGGISQPDIGWAAEENPRHVLTELAIVKLPASVVPCNLVQRVPRDHLDIFLQKV